jgi:hypothetical protein
MLQGKIYFVRADPSDIELTSLKEYQLRYQYNLILFDQLILITFTVSGMFYFCRVETGILRQNNRSSSEVHSLAFFTIQDMGYITSAFNLAAVLSAFLFPTASDSGKL